MARRKAPRVGNNTRHYTLTRRSARHPLGFCGGRKKGYGLPGAAKNTGGEALAKAG
jgi:hypothetical protein